MVCANVRNSRNLMLKCNKFVDFPFGNIGQCDGKNTIVNPKKTICYQLLITKIDP